MEKVINFCKQIFTLNDFADYFMFSILIIALIAFLFSIFFLFKSIYEEIYSLIDVFKRPLKRGVGKIINGYFMESITLPAGRGISIPDMYLINIEIQEIEVEVCVSEEFYEEAEEGKEVRVAYLIGRLSKDIYVKALV